MAGIARGKILPIEKFKQVCEKSSLHLPESVFGQSVLGGETGYGVLDQSDKDVMLIPVESSCKIVPWYSEPTAQVIHDAYYHNGEEVDISTRTVLKRVLKLFSDNGWLALVAPEMEFFLVEMSADANNPLKSPAGRSGRKEIASQAYGIDAVSDFDPLVNDIYDYCEAQELGIDTLTHEAGAAQLEINLNHGDALDLADQAFLFKRTVRQTAIKHRCHATFMAKPMQNQPGSSMHIHVSVVNAKSGANIMSTPDGSPSAAFGHALGGLQRHLGEAMALMAPYVNSYRRTYGASDAPATLAWGHDNRTTGLRVPPCDAAQRRIENRIPGADANPYLAIAATLASLFLGLRDRLRAGSSTDVDENEERTGPALPRNLDAALDALDGSREMREILGERFVSLFCEVKRSEAAAFLEVISPWEREHLLLNV